MELVIQNICKTYKKNQVKALQNISTTLKPGVYGLLGPNGSGKSTLMNIITLNLRADSGLILYNGENIRRLGRDYVSKLGYMPQNQGLYEDFTANQFLWYMAALKGLKTETAKKQIEELLDVVNLRERSNTKLGGFSGGMKQRVLIAQALLSDPEILILDEPTAGLDPKERVRVRNFISQIAVNKIVLMATHVVSDVEPIAREIIFIREGRIINQDIPSKLLSQMTGCVWQATIDNEKMSLCQQQYLVSSIAAGREGKMNVRIVHDTKPDLTDTVECVPTLEDLYMFLFQESDDKSESAIL